MALKGLKEFIKKLKTPVDGYDLIDIFGQIDHEKIAKDLNLKEVGAEKGKHNLPAADSTIDDEIEFQIKEKIESAKLNAYLLAQDHIVTLNQRISNLDFESHFTELRQNSLLTISEIQTEIELGLNGMYTRRRKYLEAKKEFALFREINGLEHRTAKITTPFGKTLRVLIILIMVVVETYFNGIYLAKSNALGLFGGIIEAATFALLNIGYSIILTFFVIRQIVRKSFFWVLIGLIGILAWICVVFFINLGLAHYREVAATIFEGAGADVLQRILANPFDLKEIKSWMLFAIGTLFATFTLVDVISFSDIYPGYTKRQTKWDEEEEEYKEAFILYTETFDDIKEEYIETLKEIGKAISIRERALDSIISSSGRLNNLYLFHIQHLQRISDLLFSRYYESNRATRTEREPVRFNERFIIEKSELEFDFLAKTNQIKQSISNAKEFLDEQIQQVLDEHKKAIGVLNNLEKLDLDKLDKNIKEFSDG